MGKVNVIAISLIILAVVIGAIFLFNPRETQEEQIIQSVSSNNQEVIENNVIVSEVVSNGPGWIVIHADDEGKPGKILGYSSVSKGPNTNVVVTIDSSEATPRVFAMLHVDNGIIGSFEFPGVDAPERHEDETIIVVPFDVEVKTGEGTTQIEPQPEQISIKEFNIEADDSGFYINSEDVSSISVNREDIVKILFDVKSQGVYYGGLDFKGCGQQTLRVSPGSSARVQFTAQDDCVITSYWPSSGTIKDNLQVLVS